MRRSPAFVLAVASLAIGVATLPPTRAETPTAPPIAAAPAGTELPPLPERSARTANYQIEARLDEPNHTIDGRLVLEWTNRSGQALSAFPFHLYWNAFRNNLSTSARGKGRRAARFGDPPERRAFGYTEVRSIRLIRRESEDLTPTLRYLDPDEGNADDRTLAEVRSARPVAPGETVRFEVEWRSLVPHGGVGRAGWVHDYHFIVQWFPKIAARYEDRWNAHTFHPWSEFFSDFGVYDVRLTLPRGFVVGATGRQVGDRASSPDGTETLRFVQEDVHDFAWTASRRYLERQARFDEPGLPPVEVRLLLQPEHAHFADRYLEATKLALRAYGHGSAPYPYPQLTVVDPAWGSASGGMEYPTLFTGGTNVWAPRALGQLESLVVHEAGHQFFYGLVANNEFEEAWLDEGLNSYLEDKAVFEHLGPAGLARTYFGPDGGRGRRSGFPIVAPRVAIGRGKDHLDDLRAFGEADVMARRGWDYRVADSYTVNSYGKPALTFQTLEGLLGEEVMQRVLRVYARRFRFAHPTTEDLITTVNEVTGGDYRWFFDETFFSSHHCDYAVEVENRRPSPPVGFTEGRDGLTYAEPGAAPEAGPESWEPEVVVKRLGEVRLPTEVLVEFADGSRKRETWDGKERWTRFRYPRGPRVVRAVVDPEGRVALDVNPSNNAWREETGLGRRAAAKWSARFLLWLQDLLELHAVLG